MGLSEHTSLTRLQTHANIVSVDLSVSVFSDNLRGGAPYDQIFNR